MAQQVNVWRTPHAAVWKKDDEGSICLKHFYENHVSLDQIEMEKCSLYVDVLMEYIHKQIEQEIDKENGACIEIGPLVRQGSSTEGTKIDHADEFDIVIPFTFKKGIITQVIESPTDFLPAGMAKIKLVNGEHLDNEFKKIDKNGQPCINATFVHMTFFQKLVDKATAKAKNMKLEHILQNLDKKQKRKFMKALSNKKGSNVRVTGRVTDPPAVTLEIAITDLGRQYTVHVDIVPGFQLEDLSTRRKFLVPKRKASYTDSDLTWCISYSHFEIELFQPRKMPKGFPRKRAKRLVSCFMIVKALRRNSIKKDPASHFRSIKTYYLKNAFMYVLYFIHQDGLQIMSVSQGVALLIFFIQKALQNKCLPQFFSEHFAVKKYFPSETPHNRPKSNLLTEKDTNTLSQASLAIDDALERFSLNEDWMKSYLKSYRKRLQRFFETVVL